MTIKHDLPKWIEDDIVISNWKETNSLLWSHWAKFTTYPNNGLTYYNLPSGRCYRQKFYHNLPKEDGESMCKSLYANEVVKLTVQIADPYVMVIKKDVSATFSDMLGIIGKPSCIVIFHSIEVYFHKVVPLVSSLD